MNLTVEQCRILYEMGYEVVCHDGKIIGFMTEDGKFLTI